MKKILLLSDTHGYIDDQILFYSSKADEIWHAGDIGDISVTDNLKKKAFLRAVYGNIDNHEIRKEFPKDNRFLCEKTDVWMTHIGGYPNSYAPSIKLKIAVKPPKIFICGHSHILKIIWDKKLNLLHINPGAAGKYGFHNIRTMVRFVIEGSDIKNVEIIELGKR